MYLQLPTWSQPASNSYKARNHVIVRNRIVEISDDESEMEISPSPVQGLGHTNGKTPIAASGTTKGIAIHDYVFLH
jgi:hypothetical protein